MLETVRKQTKMSLEEAAFLLAKALKRPSYCHKALRKRELGEEWANPDEIYGLAKIYRRPDLPLAYCLNNCILCKELKFMPHQRSLIENVYMLEKEERHVLNCRPQLREIVDDNRLTRDEIEAFLKITDEEMDYIRESLALRLIALSQKENPSVLAHRRQ